MRPARQNLERPPVALRGGALFRPSPWVRPQSLDAPDTSPPPSRGPASLRDDVSTQSRRRPTLLAGAWRLPAKRVKCLLPCPAHWACFGLLLGVGHFRLPSRWWRWAGAWSHPPGHLVTETPIGRKEGSRPSKARRAD